MPALQCSVCKWSTRRPGRLPQACKSCLTAFPPKQLAALQPKSLPVSPTRSVKRISNGVSRRSESQSSNRWQNSPQRSSIYRSAVSPSPPCRRRNRSARKADNDQVPPLSRKPGPRQAQGRHSSPPHAQGRQSPPPAQAQQSPSGPHSQMDTDPYTADDDGGDTAMHSQDAAEVRAQHSREIARLQILFNASGPTESDIIENVNDQSQQLKKLMTQTHALSIQLNASAAAMTRRQDHILRW